MYAQHAQSLRKNNTNQYIILNLEELVHSIYIINYVVHVIKVALKQFF